MMGSKRRNLSGVFFREENEETGKYEAVCFEDLRGETIDRIWGGTSDEWKRKLAKALAETIVEIGNRFDIIANQRDAERVNENGAG